jgi:hypothetical protein
VGRVTLASGKGKPPTSVSEGLEGGTASAEAEESAETESAGQETEGEERLEKPTSIKNRLKSRPQDKIVKLSQK